MSLANAANGMVAEPEFFYVIDDNGGERVVVADNEESVPPAQLVISLAEIERIRELLLAVKTAPIRVTKES